MPRTVDLGEGYGTVSFPDDATDSDILSHYNALEDQRNRAISLSKLKLQNATEEVERQQPTLGKILTLAGLNLREGAVGSTKQAVGNIARSVADVFSSGDKEYMRNNPAPAGFEYQLDPEHPLNVLREAGKGIESEGTGQLKEAAELSESVGGGLPGKITQGLASSAGASAPALLAAPLGIPAAALAGGAQSYGSNLSQFKDKLMDLNPKLTEEEAFQKAQGPALLTGAVTTVLTRTFGGVEKFVDKIAKEGLKQAGAKALLRETFKSAALEFPEESLDQLAQGLVEKAAINPDKPISEILNEAAMAGLTGFALGGLTTGTIAAPVAVAENVAGKVEQSRVRRKSSQDSEARIKQVIQEREKQDATQSGTSTETPGQETAPVQEAGGGLRVRNPAEAGLETQTGTVTQPTTPTGGELTNEEKRLQGQEALVQTEPAAVKQAGFGGYQFNNPDLPQYTIPGARPGIVRHVSADTARAAGYTVPETVPTIDEWKAQGSPTVAPAEQTFESKVPSPDKHTIANEYLNENLDKIVNDVDTKYQEALGPKFGPLLKSTLGSYIRQSAMDDHPMAGSLALGYIKPFVSEKNFARIKDVIESARKFAGLQNVEFNEEEAARMSEAKRVGAAGFKPRVSGPTQTFESRVEAPVQQAVASLPPVPAGHVRLYHGEGGPQGGGTGGSFYASSAAKASTFGPEISWVDVPVARAQAAFARAKSSAFGGGDNFILEPADTSRSQKLAQKVAPPTYNLDETQYSKTAPAGTAQNPIDVQIQKADGTLQPAKFTGYYDYTSLGRGAIPSIGRILDNGQVSHGMLQAGEKIVGDVPSFEQWQQSQTQESRLVQPTQQAGLGAETVTAYLAQKGFGPNTQVVVTNDPNGDWDARSVFKGNDVQRIELNSAKLNTTEQIDTAIEHELSHVVSIDGSMDQVLNALTDDEKHGIMMDMMRLGYTTGLKQEIDARGTEALINGWKGRSWFEQLVAHVLAVAQKIGIPINAQSRLLAERIAARAVHGAMQNAMQSPAKQEQGTSYQSKIEGLQVAGTAAQAGRVAEQIYSQRESGAKELEGLAYQKKQFKMARSELKRLAEQAYGRYGASLQEDPSVNPDPSSGVKIQDGQIVVDSSFSDTLSAVGVPHDPANVQAMQAELFFEGSAKRLNNLMSNIANLQQAEQYYRALKVDESEIKKIDDTIAKLQQEADKLISAEHNDQTVGGRASEIHATEVSRPERMAQRDSLSLEPVSDFFGRQVGGYRDFMQKAEAGQKLAAALRDAATDPAELARLTAETDRWIHLPEDVRAAIKTGVPLTTEQRASAFASLAETFDDFDIMRNRMLEMVMTRIPEINKLERNLLMELADSKISKGMSEVMISDVLASLDGESGGTGTLQGQQVAQELKQRLSAIQNFALTVGKDLETNKSLFQWLANPTSQSNFMTSASAAYGVDQQTLAMILDEVRRNPAFGSAIVTLIESSNSKLANLPVVQLEEIQKLVKEGNQQAAQVVADRLMQQADARASIASSGMWNTLKKLDALKIERMALENGSAMFSELASSPEFNEIRNTVANSPYGLVEPMVAQNNTATTFKDFGAQGIPSHKGLVIGASDNPVLKSEWFHKVDQWHKTAQEHLDAYDAADALHTADPLNNPQPSALGFDLAKIRGLRDATQRFVPGSFLELSLLSEDKRWKVPRLAREMSKLSWFRQHDFVSKMVGGIPGTDLRGRLADFVNHFQIARHIIQKYNNIPRLLHAAMKSHPGIAMNMAEYRELFNELAHWGRMFGSPVQTGFVLPRSGVTVTAEDMALLHRQRSFEDDLRRRVTETNPTAGIRLRRGGRELVRAGAYVGDEGLPRHLNRQSNSFIADVVQAYGQPATTFNNTTDLSASSTDPIIAFWNKNIPLLVQHVLDVKRSDRTMRLDPFMQNTENRAATDWISHGSPTIQSVEDLVNHLVAHAPQSTGFNIRDKVIEGLNNELLQYRNAAKGIENERAERDQARNSGAVIAFSADNEFTKPAAKLELPSAFYDYGAITPAEHLAVTSRANHERVVGYATAIQRAISEIQDRLNRFRNGTLTEDEAAKSYGGDIEEMKQVLGILNQIANDFEAAYRTNNPTQKQSQWYREGFGLLTSAVLALPTVGLRNMTQGQFETYIMSRAMGLSGHRLTMWRALNQMTKTLRRFALTLGAGAMKRTDLGASVLTGKNIQIFEKLVDGIANLIGDPDYKASGDRVHELGYDTRDGFIDRLRRIWEETSEISTPEQAKQSTIKIAGEERKLGALAGLPVKAFRAAFDKMGVQQYDQAINSSLLTYAEWLQKRMEEVAINYGAERERQGLTSFDATDARWQLKPDEWGAFNSQQGNTDSLALFRLFLEGSANPEGFQLERNLWDYYQKQKAGQHPQLFTPSQFDAVQRRLLAEFNASTPANRASAAAGNNVIRNMLTLQGYVSDGLLKLINVVAGGSRDRTVLAATLGKLPTVALIALMSLLIGAFQGGLTGEWEKKIRGRAPTLPSPLDKDFWTSWKRFGEGSLRLGSAQLFYIGDLILAMRGEVQGNRGFDPVGRVLPISIIQRALNTVRGMWNTYRGSGSAKDSLAPLADFGRSITPYWLEAENAFGASQGAVKQGERILRGEAQNQNLLPESRLQSLTGPAYGPTTIVRRNLGEAVSSYYNATQTNDTASANAALDRARVEMKKLEDFYTKKYVANGDDEMTARIKAERDVWNDYQEINPVVSAMLGKRPTQAQYDLIRSNITGDRAVIVDNAINAWQSGAMALFGRPGNITREDVAVGRSSGGGIPSIAGIPGIRSSIPNSGTRSSSGGYSSVGSAPSMGYLRTPSSVRSPLRRRRVGSGLSRRRVGQSRRRLGPKVSSRRSRVRSVLGSRRRRTYAPA